MVGLIGLLVGLISVAVPKAIESGMKAKTKGELTSIVAAVKAYKQEYGQWPVAKSKMDSVADEYGSWYGPADHGKRIEGSNENFIGRYDGTERGADDESEGYSLFGGC